MLDSALAISTIATPTKNPPMQIRIMAVQLYMSLLLQTFLVVPYLLVAQRPIPIAEVWVWVLFPRTTSASVQDAALLGLQLFVISSTVIQPTLLF